MKRALRGQRGQSIVEFAMVTPVLLLLALGAFDTSALASNKVVATSAARNGARLAAQIGGVTSDNATCRGTQPAATPLAAADTPILNAVLATAFEFKRNGVHVTGLVHGDITQIDIYQPTNANGKFTDGTDLANKYRIAPTTSGGNTTPNITALSYSKPYPLTKRCQAPLGLEAEIGIKVTWTYFPPNGIPLSSITFDAANPPGGSWPADYAVEKLALCTDYCKALGA